MIERDPNTNGMPRDDADKEPCDTRVDGDTEEIRPIIEPIPLTRKKAWEKKAERPADTDGDADGRDDGDGSGDPGDTDAIRTTALATIPTWEEEGDVSGAEPEGEPAEDGDAPEDEGMEDEMDGEGESEAEDAPPANRQKAPIGLILTIAGVALACIVAGFALGSIASANVAAKVQGGSSSQPYPTSSAQSSSAYDTGSSSAASTSSSSSAASTPSSASSAGTQHQHSWVETFETIESPRATHTVEHPAEYSTQTVEDTYCNICGEIITGKVEEHRSSTGHNSWTPGVAHQIEVKTRDAWTEEVVDSEASTQRVHSGWVCETCGATMK